MAIAIKRKRSLRVEAVGASGEETWIGVLDSNFFPVDGI